MILSADLAYLADWYALDDQHVRALRLEIADVADEVGGRAAVIAEALVEATRSRRVTPTDLFPHLPLFPHPAQMGARAGEVDGSFPAIGPLRRWVAVRLSIPSLRYRKNYQSLPPYPSRRCPGSRERKKLRAPPTATARQWVSLDTDQSRLADIAALAAIVARLEADVAALRAKLAEAAVAAD